MFSENLKSLRKSRGMSQELLASQLHVVRQTVSKWESGLSVPDAEMLLRLGELFEVPVSELLGGKIERESDSDALAAQLAILNEQLAARARRSRRITRVLVCALSVIAVVALAMLLVNNRAEAKRVRESEDRIKAADELIAAIELPPCRDFEWARIYGTLETAEAAVEALSEDERSQLQNFDAYEDAKQKFFSDEYSRIANVVYSLRQDCQNQTNIVSLTLENVGLGYFYDALDSIYIMDRKETKAELDERLGYDSSEHIRLAATAMFCYLLPNESDTPEILAAKQDSTIANCADYLLLEDELWERYSLSSKQVEEFCDRYADEYPEALSALHDLSRAAHHYAELVGYLSHRPPRDPEAFLSQCEEFDAQVYALFDKCCFYF